MASSFGTTTDVMQKAAQQVQQTSEEINGELNSLMGQLESVSSMWKGQAASAFQQLMARWKEDGTKLTAALQAIAEALDSSNKNYSTVEEQNASQITRILNGL